jgi:FkbM family methyltransferase
MLEINNIRTNLIDVGALGGLQDRWKNLTALNFIGFEPDSRDKTPKRIGNEIWYRYALAGENKTLTLYELREPCNSSLLKPNIGLLATLAYRLSDFDVIKEHAVDCKTLDTICEEEKLSPDAIKIDTQGTEHIIISAASNTFQNELFSAEIEVEFKPLYCEQKLFADVDQLMRKNGFQLMDLGNHLYVKGKHSTSLSLRKGLLIAADALYFKEPAYLIGNRQNIATNKWLAILSICKVYGYLNYAYELFRELKATDKDYYLELCIEGDILSAIEQETAAHPFFTISERKYFKIRHYFEKRIRKTNANWNYGLGNP